MDDDSVLRYTEFATDAGRARQCHVCGVMCWPGAVDPLWPSEMEHDDSCTVGESEHLTVALARASEERDGLRAVGERLTQYLDHTGPQSNCAPMYGCFCGCLEALEAWRALVARAADEGEG